MALTFGEDRVVLSLTEFALVGHLYIEIFEDLGQSRYHREAQESE